MKRYGSSAFRTWAISILGFVIFVDEQLAFKWMSNIFREKISRALPAPSRRQLRAA
jgi:hypothetical protein